MRLAYIFMRQSLICLTNTKHVNFDAKNAPVAQQDRAVAS